MTAPTTQTVAPASPIATHITVIFGGVGAIVGIAALVLMLCVITVGMPTAPMNFAVVSGATFAGASCIVWTGERVIRHQTACFQSNRAASKAEIAGALKKVHKEIEAIRGEWNAAEVARVSALLDQDKPGGRFGVINGGGNGVG